MSSDQELISSLKTIESDRFSEILADRRFAENPLLPELQQLHALYLTLLQRSEKLAKDKATLESQMISLNKSLNLATKVDPMTGLPNRRALVDQMTQEFSRAARHKLESSLMYVDIDDFARVNATYGINAGDDVLVEVARVLRTCLRNEDFCGRWEGNSFLLLLPETALDGALMVANKIRESIAMTEFKAQKPGISITVSIGLCEHKSGQSVFEAVALAQNGTRNAKLGGKNRVQLAS